MLEQNDRTGKFFYEPSASKPWIKYANPDGTSLSKTERGYKEEDVKEKRIAQCKKQNGDNNNCTEENFENFPDTKKFVEFARKYSSEQKAYKRCLFDDDVRRGVLSGS